MSNRNTFSPLCQQLLDFTKLPCNMLLGVHIIKKNIVMQLRQALFTGHLSNNRPIICFAVHKKQSPFPTHIQNNGHDSFIAGYFGAHMIVNPYGKRNVVNGFLNLFPYLAIGHVGKNSSRPQPLGSPLLRLQRQMNEYVMPLFMRQFCILLC
ncbi:hypothetical protein D3C74_381220 [compost metagenome]